MKVTVWNENLHEKMEARVTELYPGGLHEYIAGFLRNEETQVRTATLDDPECGLTEEVLADTDVLVWWGHMVHDRVPDEVVDRVQRHILSGMGLVVLHSGHHSKIFRRMLGTTCNLKWRDGADLDCEAQPSDCERDTGDLLAGMRRNVRRTVRHRRPPGDGLHGMVQRRRGVPQRMYLGSGERENLLFPAGA